jgi:ubiquinone/menaquinone biosynthesis C-methylase UbiE
MSQRISNYDEFDYDYETYWEGRDYEFASELNVLNKFFNSMKGNRIIDIGGSYGRLLPVYSNIYKEQIIVDYSHKTLVKHHSELTTKYPNVKLVAANAYKLPFKENTIDAAIMVRVLHHIENVPTFYQELNRVSSDKSIYIQEFANKVHLKARINWIVKGQFKNLDKSPYQQPSQGNLEGSNTESVFLNFHPKYIEEELNKTGFAVIERSSSSFLRIPTLKNRFSTKSLVRAEKKLQKLLGRTRIAPSIFFKSLLTKVNQVDNTTMHFEEILVCPNCKGQLLFVNENAKCASCKKDYRQTGNVWDFRVD